MRDPCCLIKTFAAVTLTALLPYCLAQGSKAKPISEGITRGLHQDDIMRYTVPGPSTIASKIKCDNDGNIFAVYSVTTSLEMWREPIRRISSSSQNITEYPLYPISDYGDLSRLGFDVTPDGTVYALLQARRQNEYFQQHWVYLVAKYKNDGTEYTYVPLEETPRKRAHPTSLSVFADGNFLVSGTIKDLSDPNSPLGIFSAIYDSTGKLLHPVKIMSAPTSSAPVKASHQKRIPELAQKDYAIPLASSIRSFTATDNNIYLLQDNHLDVISSLGYLTEAYTIPPPNSALSPIQMEAAGQGYLFIYYDHVETGIPGENSRKQRLIVTVNQQTGEKSDTYRLPTSDTDFTVAACALSTSDFLFLGADAKNDLQIVHYKPD